MKKILSLIVIGLLSLSCKKALLDYRKKFVGEWHFSVIRKSREITQDNTLITDSDTIEYRGTVDYGSERNTINVNYDKGISEEYEINKEGEMEVAEYRSYGNIDDNVLLISHLSGGMMTGSELVIKGTKK